MDTAPGPEDAAHPAGDTTPAPPPLANPPQVRDPAALLRQALALIGSAGALAPWATGCNFERFLARHVADRLSFGATSELVDEVVARGISGFIDQQLDPQAIDDPEGDAVMASFPAASLSTSDLRFRYDMARAGDELSHATLRRAVSSRRHLFEVMVDFWHNHLSVYVDNLSARAYQVTFDRDVIRPHAMGRFADLLLASAQHPAMLTYLDNASSTGDNPNENYARELLELHTVGLEARFSETDVRQTALALTGWKFNQEQQFAFAPNLHHTGPLQVLGWSTPGSRGLRDGIDLLTWLARHPSTARRLAIKLCRRFVSDVPPNALVASAARVYLDNDTEIRPVLAHIVRSAEFLGTRRTKLRRPFEYLVWLLRVTKAALPEDPDSALARQLRERLDALGQPLFGWPFPDGYADDAPSWLDAEGLIQRWRLAWDLAQGQLPELAVDVVPRPRPETVGSFLRAAEEKLLVEPLSEDVHGEVLSLWGLGEDDPADFGFRSATFPDLAALLLSSPAAQLR